MSRGPLRRTMSALPRNRILHSSIRSLCSLLQEEARRRQSYAVVDHSSSWARRRGSTLPPNDYRARWPQKCRSRVDLRASWITVVEVHAVENRCVEARQQFLPHNQDFRLLRLAYEVFHTACSPLLLTRSKPRLMTWLASSARRSKSSTRLLTRTPLSEAGVAQPLERDPHVPRPKMGRAGATLPRELGIS